MAIYIFSAIFGFELNKHLIIPALKRTQYFLPLLALGLLIGTFSCVPNKKIVYLQKDDLHKKQPKDSILREHPVAKYEYRLQPEDVLNIRFNSISDEEFNFFNEFGGGGNMAMMRGGGSGLSIIGFMIDYDGNIEFPVHGKVKIAGLTTFEAEDTLQKVAQQYLESTVVKVRMMNFRFTILGEVNGEQTVVLQNNRITMAEALGLAGGLTELADRSNIKVIRQQDGVSKVFYIDMLNEDFVESPYYYIHQNDVIIVPPLRQRTFVRYFRPNLSLVGAVLGTITTTILFVNFLGNQTGNNP